MRRNGLPKHRFGIGDRFAPVLAVAAANQKCFGAGPAADKAYQRSSQHNNWKRDVEEENTKAAAAIPIITLFLSAREPTRTTA